MKRNKSRRYLEYAAALIDESCKFSSPSMDSAVQNPSPGENPAKQDPPASQATVADQAGEQKMNSSATGRGGRNKQKDMGRKAYR